MERNVDSTLGVTIQPPPNVPPPGFKELIRIIWSSMRPDGVLIGF